MDLCPVPPPHPCAPFVLPSLLPREAQLMVQSPPSHDGAHFCSPLQ